MTSFVADVSSAIQVRRPLRCTSAGLLVVIYAISQGLLPEPPELLAAIVRALGHSRALDGLKVLVTAGGTREPIDSVRYIGNRSSGRMGFAIAEEAAARGAAVTVIAANVALPDPAGAKVVRVESTAELRGIVDTLYADARREIRRQSIDDGRIGAAAAFRAPPKRLAGAAVGNGQSGRERPIGRPVRVAEPLRIGDVRDVPGVGW